MAPSTARLNADTRLRILRHRHPGQILFRMGSRSAPTPIDLYEAAETLNRPVGSDCPATRN